MSELQMCPVCTGSGIVDAGFYDRTSNTWTNAGGTEQCRACSGKGYVVIPEREDAYTKQVKKIAYIKEKKK